MDKNVQLISNELLKLASEINNEIKRVFKIKKNTGKLNFENYSIGAQDITTELDHSIGKMYINKIYKKFSKLLTIDSEETTERTGKGNITLRLDPLDGTKHLFTGIPFLSSTVSIVEDNDAKFSMVLDVFAENVYHAFLDGGAFINNSPIKTSNLGINNDFSFVMYESVNPILYPKDPVKYNLFIQKLSLVSQKTYRMRNFGLSSLSVCYVADGSASAFIDFSNTTKIYDIEAAILIAKESGAIVGDLNGNNIEKVSYQEKGDKKLDNNLIIANKIAYEDIINIFSKVN